MAARENVRQALQDQSSPPWSLSFGHAAAGQRIAGFVGSWQSIKRTKPNHSTSWALVCCYQDQPRPGQTRLNRASAARLCKRRLLRRGAESTVIGQPGGCPHWPTSHTCLSKLSWLVPSRCEELMSRSPRMCKPGLCAYVVAGGSKSETATAHVGMYVDGSVAAFRNQHYIAGWYTWCHGRRKMHGLGLV